MKYNSKDMIFLPVASTFLPRVHFITVLREERFLKKKEGRKKKKKNPTFFGKEPFPKASPES